MGKQENNRIVDELLSGIAQGYTNEEYVNEQLFPVVPVMKEHGKYRKFTKDLFRFHDAKRAIGADSNILDLAPGDPGEWQLDEYDLGVPIDYREESETTDINLERARTFELSEIMALRREKKVADAVQTQGNYTSSNTSAVGTKWNTSSGLPLTDIAAAIEVVRSNIGRRPNVALFGASAWNSAKSNPQVIDRIKYTSRDSVTTQIMAELIEIPKVVVGKAVWVNDAGTQADVWGDNLILAYVTPGVRDQRSYRTPSFGYTLTKKGWAPIDIYFPSNAGGKVKVIRYTTIETQLFHGEIAGYFLRDTNS